MKNTFRCLALSLSSAALAVTASAQTGWRAEVGASYFDLQGARFERSPAPLRTSGGASRVAPFVAVGYQFDEMLGVRVSYHAIGELETVAKFGSPPSQGEPVTTPVVTWGHYEDEVHLLTVAPEFGWSRGRVRFTVAPEINWLSSRGRAVYTSEDPSVAAIPPRRHSENGFTLGGAFGVSYALTERAAVSLTYHYTDLDPSFDREAHVFSGGIKWSF